jgi:hypothetical protein
MSEKNFSYDKSNEDDNELHLNSLKVPIYVSHIKPGNTLCANNDSFLVQDGSTTIEIRVPPNFEPKIIPWRNGLIRDIVWCPELNVYILLTQKSLFTFNPLSIIAPPTTTINTDTQLKVTVYSKIKPYNQESSFWRCACIGTTLYICYSGRKSFSRIFDLIFLLIIGFGTVIDEYIIKRSSCELTNRWTPPKTCATDEGIWCIRYHSDTNQLGMTVMNAQTNQWRFQIRNRRNLSIIWQTGLPIGHGDCELSPLANGEWLIINSYGVRLIQIANHELKAAVEYERELKNAITMGNQYFLVRTKNTIEIHPIKKEEN